MLNLEKTTGLVLKIPMIPNADKLKTVLLTGALIIVSLIHALATPSTDGLWKKGNELYKQKLYDSALTCFLQVASQTSGSAEVYYNIANTYYRLNNIAPAVLYYEKALHLKPGYAEAKENLLVTQNRIPNHIQAVPEIFFIRWWNQLTQGALANLWATLAVIIFTIILLIMLANRLRRAGRVVPVQVNGILWLVWAVTLVIAIAAAGNASGTNVGVVMQGDVPLLAGDLKGKALALVPEGTTVKVKARNGDFAEVTLPDGRSGYIQLAYIRTIDKI